MDVATTYATMTESNRMKVIAMCVLYFMSTRLLSLMTVWAETKRGDKLLLLSHLDYDIFISQLTNKQTDSVV